MGEVKRISVADARGGLVEAVLGSVQGMMKKRGLGSRRGQKYKPGDVYALCDEGALEAAVQAAQSEDVAVKYASLVQIAKLASCPRHRKQFFTGKSTEILCEHANEKDLDKIFPQRNSLGQVSPQLSKNFTQFIGVSYESVHPKCILAKAFAGLTEYQTCCKWDTGLEFLRNKQVMLSIAKLVDETSWCKTSQHLLAAALKAICTTVNAGKEKDIQLALDHGLEDILSKLMRNAKENSR